MDKKIWLKAINSTKEELIEWLCEIYEADEILKDIIINYEELNKSIIKIDDNYNDMQATCVDVNGQTKYFSYIRTWN